MPETLNNFESVCESSVELQIPNNEIQSNNEKLTRFADLQDVQRHMRESWVSIDELLRQACRTNDKNEKTRILNMIGAQRARILTEMGHVAA